MAKTQVIIATHSSTVVKSLDLKNIRILLPNGESKQILENDREFLQYNLLNDVNYIAFGDITEEYQ
jgi:predicted ATP-dependent endonuclease of OLD family